MSLNAGSTFLEPPIPGDASDAPGPRPQTRRGRRGLSVFAENKLAVVGVGIIVFMVLFSFVGPLVYHTNQVNTNLLERHPAAGPAAPARYRRGRLRRRSGD